MGQPAAKQRDKVMIAEIYSIRVPSSMLVQGFAIGTLFRR